MNQVIALKAFTDNYIWVIHNQSECIIVDPGDAAPVFEFLADHKHLKPSHILITHRHWDHTDGVAAIKQAYPDIQVFGPANSSFNGIEHALLDGDKIELNAYQLSFNVWHLPGHTEDHIAYFNDDWLFCGDTLFSAGCGRILGGTINQFVNSLNRICTLPDNIKIYCTHEYTQANIRFAQTIEPDNSVLKRYADKVAQLRQANQISLPTQLGLEKQINPFLRCDQTAVIYQAQQLSGQKLSNQTETFAALRQLKDCF